MNKDKVSYCSICEKDTVFTFSNSGNKKTCHSCTTEYRRSLIIVYDGDSGKEKIMGENWMKVI